MRERIKYLDELLLLIAILMTSIQALSGDRLLLIPIILSLLILGFKSTIKLKKIFYLGAITMAVSSLFGLLITGYSQYFCILNFLVLLIFVLMVDNGACYSDATKFTCLKIDVIYIIFLLLILWGAIKGTISEDGSIIFSGMTDKNYTAVFLFLFFLYSNKRDKISGIIISFIIAIFMVNSRSLLLMFALYYILMYFRDYVYKFMDKIKANYFKIVILFFIVIMLFSLLWVFVISVNGYDTQHYASINDGSNRVRFVSNIRSFLFLLEDPSKSVLCGYGYEYVSELGVDVTYSQLPIYLGIKILQAHNSYLNLMIKIGIVPCVIYFVLLGYVLDRIHSKDNLQYTLPYMVNAMFMHSLLNGTWLILFLAVLIVPQKKGRIWKVVSNFKMPRLRLMRN